MKLPAWRPHVNFVTIHYAYIIFMGVLSLAILYPAGNLTAVDAYFFGASSSTESGLNPVDVKELYTYQQLYVYFIPILTNLGFINACVVLVRFLWFRKHLNSTVRRIRQARPQGEPSDPKDDDLEIGNDKEDAPDAGRTESDNTTENDNAATNTHERSRTINFDPSVDHHPKSAESALYIPGPRDRDQGHPIVELDHSNVDSRDDISITEAPPLGTPSRSGLRRRLVDNIPLGETRTMDRVTSVASSIFVMGPDPRRARPAGSRSLSQQRETETKSQLSLSRQATVGRNSEFYNLTKQDRERLGGIEYRSLKLLLKIVFSYYFGLHLFGAVCLIGWIQYADQKYKDVLAEAGQNMNWWAIYSAQTMVDNLGLTLTPDSMISFRDAQWPMFIMSFLAFAGNTLYPVFMRLTIWTMSKLTPKSSSIQESLSFLLNHPRRCYTLLFPSGPTWILFGVIFALNFVDTLLIIVLDLHNPEVNALPVGRRILAAIFQAASSRHTGTATFNLANVNPAVQFSLLVMMYIAIFPIAVSIRASNTLEEKSLGIYETEGSLNENSRKDYLVTHIRNQFSFDLWFVFLGVFCICIAEADKIVDNSIPAFTVWTIFFEVTSAYGNVGLSLGYPQGTTSLSGVFSTFSKLVVCVVMIRGRHRGLPYALDRAIMLPEETLVSEEDQPSDNRE